MANIWGAQKEVQLGTWKEIRQFGFVPSDRSFGTLNDGTQALFFQGDSLEWHHNITDKKFKGMWYVTTETLEEIRRQEGLIR